MLNFPTIATKPAAALCAAAALTLVLAISAWHPSPAHADGGASSARIQPAAPADSGAALRDYTLRLLRALTDRDSNNWVRYWQALAHCDAPPARSAPAASPLDRALLALTAAICSRLDARLGVNPAAYPPRAKDRVAGLMTIEPGAALGYTLFTGDWSSDTFLIDPLGRVAHAWHTETLLDNAKLLDNGNLLATGQDTVFEFDPRGNIVWQRKIDGRLHHDFLKMPNGNILLLVQARKTREQAIAAGANPQFVHERGVKHDYLLEVRPAGASGGEIVWEWSVWDHLVQDFDPTKPNYGAIAEHPELIDINFPPIPLLDWTHINAIDYNPDLDQIMLSPRHFSELWIIDRSPTTEEARGNSGGNGGMGGDLLYRWGNPRAYGNGAAADQRLFWQHRPHWIPPGLPGAGNILLFNNGKEFPGYERSHSSIDELVPPADGYRYRRAPYPPDALAWTYASPTPADFYAPFLSGAQRLPNGNTLIVHGPAGTISQVTPSGKPVWKYIIPRHYHISLWQDKGPPARLTYGTPDGAQPSSVIQNKVHRASWYPPDHPGLQALDLAPDAPLEVDQDLLDWARAALAAGHFGAPLANSDFDIYLDNQEDENILIYFKRPCAADRARERFFLHITPAHARDLPAHRQGHGFENLNFNYLGGELHSSDDWCAAMQRLPSYPIQRISTGQFNHAGQIWRADINLNE